MRRSDLLVAAALALEVVILFYPAVAGQGVFFQRDIHAYWYPHMAVARRALAEGALPSWNPYVAFGRPLLADPSVSLFYPPTWVNLVVSPSIYYTIFVVVHAWAAGFGAYRLARAHGVSPAGAAMAGASWAASGPLLSAANLFHHFASAAWMPWVLHAVTRLLNGPSPAHALVLGALAGGQALAGSADLCLFTAVAAALQCVTRAADGGESRRTAAACGLAAAALYGACLAAAQWLPVVGVLSGGSRGSLSPGTRSLWSLHPASLVDVLVPRLVADAPLTAATRADLFEGRGPLLVCLYLGSASLPLVVLGALGGAPRLRRWALCALSFHLVMALGRHTPAFGLLAEWPPFSFLRYPAKHLVPASLFWALLAGAGLDTARAAWTSHERRRAAAAAALAGLLALSALGAARGIGRRPEVLAAWIATPDPATAALLVQKLTWTAVAAGGASLLVLAGVARERARPSLSLACALLALADLVAVGGRINVVAPPELLRYRPPAAAALVEMRGPVRLCVQQESADLLNGWLRSGPEEWNSERGWARGTIETLVPPIGARWGIEGSYEPNLTGMERPIIGQLAGIIHREGMHPASLKILQAGAVTHVASLRAPAVFGTREVFSTETVFRHPLRLYAVPDPLPRAYLVHAARALSGMDAYYAFFDSGFDPRREVILPAGIDIGAAGAPNTAEEVREIERTLNSVSLDVNASAPGWLVVVEGYDVGWRATVDGTKAPVLLANMIFRAVPVAAGRHRVALRYHTPFLATGMLLSITAAVLGLGFAFRAARSRSGAEATTRH
jgi:hypothetical protein